MATVNYNGNTYRSIKQVPRQLGITYFAVIKRLQAGWTLAQAVGDESKANEDTLRQSIVYEGKYYPSLRSLINHLNVVSEKTVLRRLKKGWNLEKAISEPLIDFRRGGDIYAITCHATNKRYVGLTRTNLGHRWNAHLERIARGGYAVGSIHADIAKYGEDAFTMEILDSADNLADLKRKESEWINKLRTNIDGYNLTNGGELGGGNGRKTEYDGVVYPSLKAAAKAYSEKEGITLDCAKWRLYKNKHNPPKKHGMTGTKIYKAWDSIIHNGYSVCDRWKDFFNFMEDMGDNCMDGLVLSRIDRNKGYSPDNCVWVTRKDHSQIREGCIPVVVNGESFDNLSAACRRYGRVGIGTAWNRIKSGWDATKAVTIPPRRRNLSKVAKITVVSVLVVLGLSACGGEPTPQQKAERQLKNAMDVCTTFVSRKLRSPSTAEFPYYHQMTAFKNGDGVYHVHSYVDAQNGFGAMIRTNYECKVKHAGGDNWQLVALNM